MASDACIPPSGRLTVRELIDGKPPDKAEEAKANLVHLANSRQGLIEKLKDSGFSAEEAAYGADAVLDE